MARKGQKRRVISSSSSLGSNIDKVKNTLTYLEKEDALKLMIEGKATPRTLAIHYWICCSENGEDVVVEDPLVMIDAVARLKTYFRNTACPEGEESMIKVLKILKSHLNFE